MPAYQVSRTILIEKPIAEVRAVLANYETWPSWSPWLIMEPDCQVKYGGTQGEVGGNYHWTGKMVGEGKMTLTEKTDTVLKSDLQFIKPFKSFANANFHLAETEHGTEVTWTLEAKLPWFLFFMKNMMQTMIGMDYDRGLRMLKGLLEEGRVDSQLTLIGTRTMPTTHYIALANEAAIDKLKDIIPADYARLAELFQEMNIEGAGAPFTLYYKMDMKTTVNSVRNCFPVPAAVDVPAPFICDKIEACPTYVVEHKGPYHFVGNAWSFAMFAARHYKVKTKKSPTGFERYLNDPVKTDAKELLTEICLFEK